MIYFKYSLYVVFSCAFKKKSNFREIIHLFEIALGLCLYSILEKNERFSSSKWL